MKIVMLIVLLCPFPLFGIEDEDLEGTWYRTYGIYRPWTDDNQGTVSYYEEDLNFRKDGIVLISDGGSEKITGKSYYSLLERDDEDFIVFYKPKQDPKDPEIQERQGFFITITHDKKNHDILRMMTVTEAQSKKKKKGIRYQRVQDDKSISEFIVPYNTPDK